MTLEERDEFTKNLEEIYNASRKKVERLREKRRKAFRAKQTVEEVSVHVAKKRAVVRKALNEIFTQIENVESAYLPTLATRYFHELSNLRHEVIALKKSTESLSVELIEKARRLRDESTKRREVREQLQDAKLQLRGAKLDRHKPVQEFRRTPQHLRVWACYANGVSPNIFIEIALLAIPTN
jgi:hypothetical protein